MLRESLIEPRIGYPTGQCVLWPEVFFWEPRSLYLNSSELKGQEAQTLQCVTTNDGGQDHSYFHPLGPRFMYSTYWDTHHVSLLIYSEHYIFKDGFHPGTHFQGDTSAMASTCPIILSGWQHLGGAVGNMTVYLMGSVKWATWSDVLLFGTL